jgi:hypothetical protein
LKVAAEKIISFRRTSPRLRVRRVILVVAARKTLTKDLVEDGIMEPGGDKD